MKITVLTYSGYKADERPASFVLGSVEYRVVEVIDRYYNPDEDIFKVKASDGCIYIIGRNLKGDFWELKGYLRDEKK